MPTRGRILRLPPNRVWRTYLGGRELDRLAASSAPADTHFPEDWIASTTRATNPADATRHPSALADQSRIENPKSKIPEGLSPVLVGADPIPRTFADLLAAEPAHYLGAGHVARHGAAPQLLVKFLDPSIRLHFQVHPTAAFARRFLNAPSGKTEAYHILAVRDDLPHPPYLYLGFQRPPTRAQLRRMIETQDIAALEACFDKIPVNVGDTFIVPGGVPHALGPGLLLAEIMEPSDLVVRFEFKRGGYTLPESARFMGRGLEFCLDVFDYATWSADRIFTEALCPPRRLRPLGPDSYQDKLIGPERTPCFRIRKSHLRGPITRHDSECFIGIVTAGSGTLTAGGETHRLRTFDKFFFPAALGAWELNPDPTLDLLECLPPAP
ncbi:MAG: phosphoheptose isomerase [Undibacterium sp.]|nr:phosphoheptose isomerase [Opitutaceae bacterium]